MTPGSLPSVRLRQSRGWFLGLLRGLTGRHGCERQRLQRCSERDEEQQAGSARYVRTNIGPVRDPGGGGEARLGKRPMVLGSAEGLGELIVGPGSGEVRMGDGDGVVVRWTVWWVYLGLLGDTGDVVMMGTWQRRGLCTGITWVRVAVLESVWWEYRGCAAVLGSSTVGVLRGRRRYWGVPLTPLTTQGEYRGLPWPGEQPRGTTPAGMYIV